MPKSITFETTIVNRVQTVVNGLPELAGLKLNQAQSMNKAISIFLEKNENVNSKRKNSKN